MHRTRQCRGWKPCRNCGGRPGFESIDTRVIRIAVVYSDFDDFWGSYVAPTGPVGLFIQSMSPGEKEQLRARVREQLSIAADGRVAYEAFANAVKGRIPV